MSSQVARTARASSLPAVYKSKHVLPLIIIGIVVAGLTAAQALLIDWLPAATSEQADRTFTLLWVLFWCSTFFFTIVTAVLIYSIWKFRVSDDDLGDGPPIHGNTKLEVVWTVIPSIVLVFVAIYGYIVMQRNEAVVAGNLKVDVYAQQFNWVFGYPDAGFQTGTLVVPEGKQVELHLRARDVIHSFWVPEFGVKGDAVPGIDNVIWTTPTKTGTYPVVCAELCGVGHAVMRAKVVVLSQVDFDAWLAKSKGKVGSTTSTPATSTPATSTPATSTPAAAGTTAASPSGNATMGKTVFAASCTGCHMGDGTQDGGVGPKLQGTGLTLDLVTDQIKNGGAVMPAGLVSGADEANVAAYVMTLQK